ncbi:glycosyltransferase [Cetobacterium sp. 2G large]|uniref:glycosyltransferase n=1 Tax=Cetobacterium sp. 2G large TaxID=2759680 RepID=UPI00163D26D4|nr:glycosyltransferase [Cetobacterium sp. 2G large]MBC2852530.1 glycosyltransferase [Cetobacterium sp. 2G large]
MKKIVFLTESMVEAGGVVRVITTWSNYLARENQIEIVSVKDGKPFFTLENNVKFTIIEFDFKNRILGLLKNIYLMYKFLSEYKDTVVIVNKSLYIEPIYFWRKLGFFRKNKIYYFVHGGNSDFKDFYKKRLFTKHRVRMIFEKFDKIICLYKDRENMEMPKEVDAKKIYYLSNPIPYCKNTETVLKENIILFLGRVTKEKGVDCLIRAWSFIETKYPDWEVQIVGEGKDKEEFIKLSKNIKVENIKFFNATYEPEKYYKESKIFILPSLFEGMPMAILEAKFFENIVISSKTAGGIKLITDNETGYLFEIGKEKELSEKIEEAIFELKKYNHNSECKIIIKSNIEIEEYEIDKLGKKWVELLC